MNAEEHAKLVDALLPDDQIEEPLASAGRFANGRTIPRRGARYES